MSFSESAKFAEVTIRCLMVAASSATFGGLTAAKTSVALEAATSTDIMEWVPVDVTDQVATVVAERLGVRFAVATMSDVVEARWVMAVVALGKE